MQKIAGKPINQAANSPINIKLCFSVIILNIVQQTKGRRE